MAAENQNTAQPIVTPVALPGVPAQTPSVDPATAQPSNLTAPENVVAMIEKARQDEKAKLYGTLEKQKAEMKAQQDALESANKKVKELEVLANKDLTSDQRIEARITALQEQIASERKQREAEVAEANKRNQQTQLESYKHRRLAEVGINNLIPELVDGNSPEHIDASILVAQAEYQRLRQKMFSEFAAQNGLGQGAVPSAVGGSPATPSPHFTPQQGIGFPSQVNPMPVAEQQLDMNTLASMTSEEAVRSGAYEQVRQSLLNNLKQASGNVGGHNLGTSPRHMAIGNNVPHTDVGGGVMQPTGFPTGPVRPANVQPGSAAGNIGGQHVDARQAAIDAVNRTHSGQNPLAQGEHAAGGASAATAAFQSRFNPTPPLR